MWPVLLLSSPYFVFISKSSSAEGWPEFSFQPDVAAHGNISPCCCPFHVWHVTSRAAEQLLLQTSKRGLGLNLDLIRILNFLGMFLLLLINYTKFPQPTTLAIRIPKPQPVWQSNSGLCRARNAHVCPDALQWYFASNSTLWSSSTERDKVLTSCAHTGYRMIYQPAIKQCKYRL